MTNDEVLQIMNEEDQTVALAVKEELPQISKAVAFVVLLQKIIAS